MEENIPQQKPPGRKFAPIFWPLLLIAFGVLLLLNTLGLLQRSVWDILWNLWPLFFIALGLDALIRKKEIFGPVFWIGLGSVFLLINFGVLSWNAWNVLFRLWPLLLVTAGLEILLGRRSIWISLPVTILVLGGLAVALGMTGMRIPAGNTVETSINEPLGLAERGEINIAMGVGDLNVYPLEDSKALIEGEISSEGTSVHSRSSVRGDTVVYSLEHNNPVVIPFEDAWQWDLGLTTQVPIGLDSSMGVGSMNLSLDQMLLDQIQIGQGVGEVEVILPDGDYRAEVEQAVGQMLIEIPRDVPVRLEVSRAISGLDVPSDFERNNDYYYSPGAQDVDEYIRIEISQAIGSITVRYR
jgi:hypothetical protein